MWLGHGQGLGFKGASSIRHIVRLHLLMATLAFSIVQTATCSPLHTTQASCQLCDESGGRHCETYDMQDLCLGEVQHKRAGQECGADDWYSRVTTGCEDPANILVAERCHGVGVAAVAADRDLHGRQDGGQVRRALRHDADVRQHHERAPVLLCARQRMSAGCFACMSATTSCNTKERDHVQHGLKKHAHRACIHTMRE